MPFGKNLKIQKNDEILEILEQFSVNGFKIKYEQIHKGWDVAHLYAEIE